MNNSQTKKREGLIYTGYTGGYNKNKVQMSVGYTGTWHKKIPRQIFLGYGGDFLREISTQSLAIKSIRVYYPIFRDIYSDYLPASIWIHDHTKCFSW